MGDCEQKTTTTTQPSQKEEKTNPTTFARDLSSSLCEL
jgi:hypothetical protein